MRRVVLLGGGHAHAFVLRALVDEPIHGAQITLVSPYPAHTYSGMLPGLVAGHYTVKDVQIDLARLAQRSGVEWIQGEVSGLDAAARRVLLADGRTLDYDVASLNLGSLPATEAVPGSAAFALPAKPFERFLEGWQQMLDQSGSSPRIAVIGAGAAGVEIAMAIRHRLVGLGRETEVDLYSDRPMFRMRVARRVHRALEANGVRLLEPRPVRALESDGTVVSDPGRERYDRIVWTAGAASLPWLRQSGLATDAAGFVQIDRWLRSTSHPDVFAVGDCATMSERPHPKSGVYAVRHGELLVRNLRFSLAGSLVQAFYPQARALALISCGARAAIADWNGLTAEGAWVWRWKDWLDRRWVERFRL